MAGARIGYKPAGGHSELDGSVHNMSERAYRQYAFDASQFSGVALGVYAPPRTWGVTATYQFEETDGEPLRPLLETTVHGPQPHGLKVVYAVLAERIEP